MTAKLHEIPYQLHPSHRTRFSDASSFDEVCVLCGATDISGFGWGSLKFECRGTDEKRKEYDEKRAQFA